MSDYKPGSFFLVSVNGWAGFAIGVGQALAGDPSRYEHAGIVLDADGTILEAEPGGARIANLSEYAGRPLLVSDAPVLNRLRALPDALFWRIGDHEPPDVEGSIRASVVAEARKLVGVPYSGLDYLALGLLHLHLPSRWVRQRVKDSGHMICSQLCDAVYLSAGIHLFSDGRWPGDVLPADLAAYAEDWVAGR